MTTCVILCSELAMHVGGFPAMSATTIAVEGAAKEDKDLLETAKKILRAHIEHVKVGTDTLNAAGELYKIVQSEPSIKFFEGTPTCITVCLLHRYLVVCACRGDVA